jgi:disulfide bond formation protein DsbB
MTACTSCPVFTLRRLLLAMGVLFIAMLGFGYYLQEVQGLQPCPMCIVQRYCLAAVAALALAAAATPKACLHKAAAWLSVLIAGFGAFTAARQSWLQWNPPKFSSCARDPFSMVNNIGLAQVIPKVFAGHGNCTAVDWTFLGGSIANWSFLIFSASIIALLAALVCCRCAKK